MDRYEHKHAPTLRVVMIVDYISSFDDKGVALSDIVKHLDIPKTTVFNILNTLVDTEVIEETGTNIKKYRLGFQAYVLAKRYVEKMTLIQIADPIMKELSALTELTTFIAKQDKSKIFYIYKHEAVISYRTLANVGSANYINTTALGKAYLMTLTDDKLTEKLDEITYQKNTEKTIMKPEIMKIEIHQSQSRGFAIDNEEHDTGLVCLGAPIYNELGQYEASISMSGSTQILESIDLYGRLLKQAAEKISTLLGYRSDRQ